MPHDVDYVDGEIIWIFDDPDWDMYVFKRTSVKDVDGGSWYATNVTTSAGCTDW